MREPVLPMSILGTGSFTEGIAHDTATLVRAAGSSRDPAEIARKTGIDRRVFFDDTTSAAHAGAEALRRALTASGLTPPALRRVIFVNSTGGDRRIPATVNALLAELGVRDTCDGFDVNNACTGFLSAFDLAARSVATGLGPVAVVVSEALSRHIAPEDHRSYFVLGDAAVAVIVGESEGGSGVLAASFGNDAGIRGVVHLDHNVPGGKRELIRFEPNYDEMSRIAVRALTSSADRVLDLAGLTMSDVDWVLPHQPNGKMIETIVEALGVPHDRIVPIVREFGSVGAAAIALSLDRLLAERRARAGQTLLMIGVGGGVSYGAVIYRIGSAERR